jgi:hypothetical protein
LEAQNAENDFEWTFNTSKYRIFDFNQFVFWESQKADIEFSVPFALSNFAFSISPMSHFGSPKSQTILSQGELKACNISL